MKILIVGLGLIGGSLAKALSAYTDAKVVGMDKDDKTLALALDEGAIRYIAGEPDLEDADVTILCLTPQNIINFVAENHEKMNKNGLVLDVCGVKRDIMACFREYFRPNGPQYIGMHPMAGRELFGYEHALVNLFQGASLVMTKDPELDYDVDWAKLEEYVYALGFRKLVPDHRLHFAAGARCLQCLHQKPDDAARGRLQRRLLPRSDAGGASRREDVDGSLPAQCRLSRG